jgi:hypothetical protein
MEKPDLSARQAARKGFFHGLLAGGKDGMTFLVLYRPGTPETDRAPSQEQVDAMGKLIGDMTKAGVLLASEDCAPSARGARLRIDNGAFTVTDGPFPETRDLIAGFLLMRVSSKAEAIEWGKRFLAVVGEGESEIRQLSEVPAP